jgi:hypothetical protein
MPSADRCHGDSKSYFKYATNTNCRIFASQRSQLGMQTTTEAVQMTILTSVTARISPSTHPRATGQPVTGTNVSPLNVFLHYPPTAQHNSC